MKHTIRSLLSPLCYATALAVAIPLFAIPAQGQTDGSAPALREDYVNRYARPGEATQTVYVWGAVNRAGIWKISPDTDLVELFSVVQPRGYGVETPSRENEIVFRIHRSVGTETRVVDEFKLGELLEMRPSKRPTLKPKDVIEVRAVEERTFSLELIGTVIGTLSSVTLLAIRVVTL